MYHLPQYGGLEYITRNIPSYMTAYSSPQQFYSIASSYREEMFVPSQNVTSSSLHGQERILPYSVHQENYTLITIQPEYHFIPSSFLKPGKEGNFVGKAEEVREFVEKAFEEIFQLSFPAHIKMSILNQEEFRKIVPSPNTIGLSINRSQE